MDRSPIPAYDAAKDVANHLRHEDERNYVELTFSEVESGEDTVYVARHTLPDSGVVMEYRLGDDLDRAMEAYEEWRKTLYRELGERLDDAVNFSVDLNPDVEGPGNSVKDAIDEAYRGSTGHVRSADASDPVERTLDRAYDESVGDVSGNEPGKE